MPIPVTKLFLSSALATGRAVRFLAAAPGDFAQTTGATPSPAWLSAVGDINTDGRADLIFGAPGDNDKAIDAGRVFVQFGPIAGTQTLGDSLTELIIDGRNAGDLTGASVGFVSDLNGDGRGEILIGAPGSDIGVQTDAGAAFVVFGKASGGVDLNDPFTGAGGGYAIKGQSAGDAAGTVVKSIADLNGDGKMDILVGAPGNDAGGANAGAAYVVWGKSTTSVVNLSSVAGGTGGFRIIGEDGGDAVGGVLSTVGDMNGDGKAEILIGTPDSKAGGTNSGAVYVVFGKSTGTQVDLTNVAAGVGGFRIKGVAQDDAGAAVSGLGDVNGDGISDILIGAPRSDGAYVVFGKSTTTEVDLANVRLGIGGFHIQAEGVGDFDLLSVAGGADFNHDGINDLVIGAPDNNEGGSKAGAVYVVWGGGSSNIDLSLIAQGIGGAKIVGADGSLTGSSVAVTPDLNGDGAADLLIGAPGSGESAYVLYADPSWQPDLNIYGTQGADVIGPGYGGAHIVGETADIILGLGGDDQINGAGGADTIEGGAGNDTLSGGAGNDSLDGGTGADAMTGGAGDDTYLVDSVLDTVTELSSEGVDTVRASIDYTLGANVEALQLTVPGHAGVGNGLANTLTGTAGADSLDGAAGADTMTGLGGDDSYVVDSAGDLVVEAAGGGTDTVTASVDYTLGDNVESLVLAGGAHLGTGNGLANSLRGGAGADTLDGLGGADVMTGLGGDDTYRVDNALDQVVEQAGQGADTVIASVDYTLAANIETLTLTGAARHGTGNAIANTITGTTGDDTLDGGAGADLLTGGLGNDTYVIDNAGDVVVEVAGGGVDTVVAAVDYVLTEGAQVENLTLTGGAHHATGNSGDNALTGGAGADVLDGGGGVDALTGGAGDDTYVIDTLTDTIVELAGGGVDTVMSSVNYTLGAEVEDLVLTGSAHIGVGNTLDNVLTGGAGSDTLSGDLGNDTLDGGAGADNMTGGAGDDTYRIDNAGDVVVEAAGGGFDTVIVSSDWTLADNIEAVQLSGSGHTLTGNAANNTLTGDVGDDILDGGLGDDTEVGGAGNDRLVSGSGHDILAGGSGDDVYVIKGGSAHIEDFQGHDTIDASEASGDSHIDLSGETGSTIDDQSCDFGGGGTVTGGMNVQFLQDLTGSFADDIANVRTLVPQIVTALQGVQATAAFGVSTFRDKPYGAFGSPGDWVYATQAAIGISPAGLTTAYGSMVASGGADLPEAQLEALLQLAVRSNTEVGFQPNAARFAVVFTDASFHTAADGTAAGILTANNGDAILDGGGIGENYPEIAQLKGALQAFNIIPIFAIAGGFEADYQGLVTALGRGSVVTLTANSSNIVAAITAGLTTATTTHLSDAIGGGGADVLIGNVGDNALTGNGGDDTLTGGAGDDALHGGGGLDVAVYSGAIGDYTLSTVAGVTTVHDGRGVGDGTDTLDGVEYLKIGGLLYNTDGTVAGSAPTAVDDAGLNVVEAAGASAGTPSVSGNALTNDSATAAPLVLTGAHAGVSGAFTAVATGTTVDGTYGVLTLNPDGTFSYALDNARAATEALNAADAVTDVFTYQVTDANGLTAQATITIAVAGANDGVITTAVDRLLVTLGQASDLDAAVLLGNDAVSNGEALTVTAVTNATGATVSLVGGKLVITAAGAASSFDYTVTGASGIVANGHVDVTAVTTDALNNKVVTAPVYAAADLVGLDGADNLSGGVGKDRLDGGAGNDSLSGGAAADVMIGGAGNDSYTVDDAADTTVELAAGGTDKVKSTVDYVLGAEVENLTLAGTAISGGGNDLANKLVGNASANILSGFGGNDTLDGQLGADQMIGGAGNDTYMVDDAGDQVVELAGEGVDTVKTSVLTYVLTDNVEKAIANGSGDFTLTGNALANTLTGGVGADVLNGLDGKDALSGGAGDDVLNGGAGADMLTGGAGADQFVFNSLTVSADKDTVKDFVSGEDHFVFDRAVFAAFAGHAAGAIDAGDLVFGTAATTASQHLIYDAAKGALYYDADGVGGAAQVQIANIANHAALLAGDFLLI